MNGFWAITRVDKKNIRNFELILVEHRVYDDISYMLLVSLSENRMFCPMYAILHALHVSLYVTLFSSSCVLLGL